ncbi:ankyrin repeat-containing domain protein, partial [Radiomyces spectabilis]|uniref:ankyrin repeat-containing domain protein n=1 Tax=Radiomyces spectabilis TaxID=64574 RepID=UPI00221EBF14
MGSPDLRLEHPDVSIWQAAAKGDLDTLRYYIDHNETDLAVLLNTRDPETECTLLHLVISSVSDPYPMLRLLLEHGAEPIARNVYNVYPIQLLSLHCSDPLPSMKLLLEYEADPNARDGDGWTPLHYAARFCRDPQPVMQLLVQHGADINAKDASQRSPIFLLLANGDHATALNWLVHDAK